MIYKGQQAIFMEETVEKVLTDYLAGLKSQEPWKSKFLKYKGFDIAWKETEAQKADSVGRPYIFIVFGPKKTAILRRNLKVTNSEGNEEIKLFKGRKHSFSFEIDLVSSEFSGSIKGAANTQTTTNLLVALMEFAFNDDIQRRYLESIGLEGISCEADTEASEETERSFPYKLSFTCYSIPEAPVGE